MQPIRIVAVDDHPILRDGLRRLLDAEPGFTVVGEAGCGRDAIGLVLDRRPDVLLLDLAMPRVSGLDVLRELRGAGVPTRSILLTAGAERHELIEALLLGARGFLTKDSATALLFKCIRAVVAGEYWLSHDRMPDLVEALQHFGLAASDAPAPAETLTRRELHVVAAILDGATNRDISAQLGLSEQTVKNYLSHIFDKVGVSNRLELALFALHHRILDRAAAAGSRTASRSGWQTPTPR